MSKRTRTAAARNIVDVTLTSSLGDIVVALEHGTYPNLKRTTLHVHPAMVPWLVAALAKGMRQQATRANALVNEVERSAKESP